MWKTFSEINKFGKETWDIKLPIFINYKFLKIFYDFHPKIKHLFAIDRNTMLYAQIFRLTFKKTKNYLPKNFLINTILSLVKFDVLYLTNAFITNIPSFISNRKINLTSLIKNINQEYSMIVIPDFLFRELEKEKEKEKYTKIEVESEMILKIKTNWNNLEDYTIELRKKYRNKLKKIIKKTDGIVIKRLSPTEINCYSNQINKLFNQIVESSQFSGPKFNTKSFYSLVNENFMSLDGYFLNNKIVGFSTLIKTEKILYSYFVGFDKKLNKSIPIYGRILIENIKYAIKVKSNTLVLGRTANEYKSNFGAIPIKSHIYLKTKNKILNTILKPIYKKLNLNKWKQRHPFKTSII